MTEGYGIRSFLARELIAEHNDYFEACREAQQLTRDTGVVHWAMPIEENKIAKENFNIGVPSHIHQLNVYFYTKCGLST
ncbi:hypothetical protein [Bacillus mycoides]|uniref:hypothetical protein n=1 Tax=Bacillus mycoides TaxID=1405 RepID=UPI001C023FA5|nr:hypothetical protein [Bacillus mycoides]QWI52607.1 hypothetical protein EXW56_27580 [Bacillus mycoides]